MALYCDFGGCNDPATVQHEMRSYIGPHICGEIRPFCAKHAGFNAELLGSSEVAFAIARKLGSPAQADTVYRGFAAEWYAE